jgi:hypothetical protein
MKSERAETGLYAENSIQKLDATSRACWGLSVFHTRAVAFAKGNSGDACERPLCGNPFHGDLIVRLGRRSQGADRISQNFASS